MFGSDLESKPSRCLWMVAALTALALHVGGAALALANLRSEENDEGLGTAGAAYAVELASPVVPDDELPPGPDADQHRASNEVTKQEAEVKDADLPKDRPVETEDPDRIVTKSASKKPKTEDARLATLETKASEYSPAQEASSRKTLDENARESDTAKAPNPGIGKDKLRAQWGNQISAYFDLHKRYPVNRNKGTEVKVSLVINRGGKVMSVNVVQSSGDQAFDDAAVSMIRRSDPVPAPPAELTDDVFSFSLEVQFKKPKK